MSDLPMQDIESLHLLLTVLLVGLLLFDEVQVSLISLSPYHAHPVLGRDVLGIDRHGGIHGRRSLSNGGLRLGAAALLTG